MPIQTRRRRGAFLAGLLAGGSVLVLAGTAPQASELSIDWSTLTVTATQIADSGESGETGETVPTTEGSETGESVPTTAGGETGESGGESGESGDGGEAGPFSDADPEVQLTANLLAIKGHLLVGRELYDAGATDAAAPHLVEPRADIYGSIEPMLGEHGLDELGEQLEHVELAAGIGEAGEGGEAGEFGDEWEEVVETVDDGIDESINETDNPLSSLLTASHLVLQEAAHEYDEATATGTVANAEEYEVGRGFYQAVRAEIEAHGDDLSGVNADKYAELIAALDEAGRAWPSATAPSSPPLTTQELNAAIAKFEIAALAFR